MPSFYVEDVDIDADEFVSACSPREIKELISALTDDGHIKASDVRQVNIGSLISPYEMLFEEHLDSLHGKLMQLTKEEEETIIKIASRFRYL